MDIDYELQALAVLASRQDPNGLIKLESADHLFHQSSAGTRWLDQVSYDPLVVRLSARGRKVLGKK